MGKKEQGSKRQYTGEFKAEAVRLGESIGGNVAAKRLGVPQSTSTNWIRRDKAGTLASKDVTLLKRPASELESEFARLRRELTNAKLDLEIVKNGGGVFREGVAVKYAWIEKHRDQFSVARMCRVFDVLRSG